MFEGLKKKFSDAIKGFVKKEEKEAEKPQPQAPVQEVRKEPARVDAPIRNTEPNPHVPGKPAVKKEHREERKIEEKPIVKQEMPRKEEKPQKIEEQKPMVHEQKKAKEEDLIKLSLVSKIKKAVLGSVVLKDSEVDGLLDTLKMSMLESDVTFDVAEEFSEDLGSRLKGKKIESRDINKEITKSVREALIDTLKKATPDFNFIEMMKEKKGGDSFVILFLGPNGTGKTTTIAKIASRLKKEGVSVVLSASDTFRAAAIEQLEHHANKIGVPIIKSGYGADPASIAFDAIAYARAHKINVVLIDSAGRQETNNSLIREVEKMVRVAKPNMTIFVGESTTGNAIANQIVEFAKHMKIDGIILTKLDADAKGGSALSISRLTGIPILFFGVGEGYDALIDYEPSAIADAILPAAS